jgi:hypothetical protein
MLTDKELEAIRRKMLELEDEPPVDGWQHIQAEVKPRPDWPWLKWLLPLLLLLLIGVGTYQLRKPAPAGEQTQIPATAPAPLAAEQSVPDSQDSQQPGQPAESARLPLAQPGSPIGRQVPARALAEETASASTAPRVLAKKQAKPAVLPVAEQERPDRRVTGIEQVGGEAVLTQQEKSKQEARSGSENVAGKETALEKVAVVASEAKTDEPVQAAIPESPVAEKPKAVEPAPQEKRAASRNEWTAGVYFAPRYAFRKFIPNATDDLLITKVTSANQLDPERMGFEFGASYSRVIRPRLFGEGSLSWMQLKENVSYTLTAGELEAIDVRETDSRQIVVESTLKTEERQLISSYAYAGLRLGASYYFLERANSRLNLTVAAGANLLVRGRTLRYSNGVWTETIEFPSAENILEQSNYNLQLGVGYNAGLSEKYELTLMPAVNYFLGSTFKEREPLGLKPYSLGLTLQLRRRFNR